MPCKVNVIRTPLFPKIVYTVSSAISTPPDVGKDKVTRLSHTYLMYQSIPKPPIHPREIPGHLTRVKLRTVGNLT